MNGFKSPMAAPSLPSPAAASPSPLMPSGAPMGPSPLQPVRRTNATRHPVSGKFVKGSRGPFGKC